MCPEWNARVRPGGLRCPWLPAKSSSPEFLPRARSPTWSRRTRPWRRNRSGPNFFPDSGWLPPPPKLFPGSGKERPWNASTRRLPIRSPLHWNIFEQVSWRIEDLELPKMLNRTELAVQYFSFQHSRSRYRWSKTSYHYFPKGYNFELITTLLCFFSKPFRTYLIWSNFWTFQTWSKIFFVLRRRA